MAVPSDAGRGRPRIAFRLEASAAIGGGHGMRCLSLARALADRGADSLFLVNAAAPATVPALDSATVRIVGPGPEETVAAIRSEWPDGADVVVCDLYRWTAPEEQAVAAAARRVLVIDDLVAAPHRCDLLLNQNFGTDPAAYDPLLPAGCRRMIGLDYALLRPDFPALRPAALERRQSPSPARTLLVSLGLTDVGGITGRVCTALATIPDFTRADIVLGPTAPSIAWVRTIAAADPRLRCHVGLEDMAQAMLEADAAIGAMGSSSWERCCLGLPTLAFILADNQRPTAQALDEAGIVALAGDAAALDDAAIRDAVADFLGDPDRLHRLSLASAALCDGHGAERVAAAMLAGLH
ncbi:MULTISPECIES: UDP-2,4-diacetamido-2,4,6-trideoxy-beta-L-altropyranose hydrolase [Inquilinus]|uniref:UDP-2,4-diacetamido-2,4, 6-trideoxy-beta-L-altropyranose hydrolase n=1 Tax=Inquilinus ginsengisoli TaxID=363840 RepID=A0ABU1K0N7_9PROT|nr:UDP-2,4-diacetamido-2,4,6-trideoxy-beta-L-altropyranose hydrolase [Inquilinus ginsengisoli]MDR6294128.1 UDP-2,4-diacetamido-2,4,6-trideoxy-beta-L-altropyranose hydrolase [Inquilinus ginsengisoli]